MSYAKVRLWDSEDTTPNGGVAYQQVPFVSARRCDCVTTMCRACIDAWKVDHMVHLPYQVKI